MNKSIILAVSAVLFAASTQVHASATGTEFNTLYTTISGWANGYLGRILGIASLLVGLGIGVVKQSVMAAVVGIAIALVSATGPAVVEGIISAGLAITNPI